jgi:1,4-alpha-glucan branching enzyme
VQWLVRDLNRVYREQAALHQFDCEPGGFQWLQADRRSTSVFAWLRRGGEGSAPVVVIANLTPQPHFAYRLGVPLPGWYEECINTDASEYGGSGIGNQGGVAATASPCDGQPCTLSLSVPPLATLVLVHRPTVEG